MHVRSTSYSILYTIEYCIHINHYSLHLRELTADQVIIEFRRENGTRLLSNNLDTHNTAVHQSRTPVAFTAAFFPGIILKSNKVQIN